MFTRLLVSCLIVALATLGHFVPGHTPVLSEEAKTRIYNHLLDTHSSEWLFSPLSLDDEGDALLGNQTESSQGVAAQEATSCSPDSCVATFGTPHSQYKFPCSLASGHVPEHPLLPLVFAGNYDLCKRLARTSARAHFCMLTFPVVLPVLPKHSYVPDFVPLGSFFLGECVAQECSAEQLRKRFLRQALRPLLVRWLLTQTHRVRLDLLFLERVAEESMVFYCINDEDRVEDEQDSRQWQALAFYLFLIFLCTLITALSVSQYYQNRATSYTTSLQASYQALVAERQGKLRFIDGVRVISMVWIVSFSSPKSHNS